MPLVGLKRASELTGKAQSTIHRAMKAGKLSATQSESGARLFDVAELERAFGLLPQPPPERNPETQLRGNGIELAELRADAAIAHARVAMLEERLRDAQSRVDELRDERDRWRAQAERLLTDQRPQRRGWLTRWWRREA
jgi:hypothetical protein